MRIRVVETRRGICVACPRKCRAYIAGGVDFEDPCAACPIVRWGPWECEEGGRLPPLLDQAKNAISSAGREAVAIVKGTPAPDEAEVGRRLGICKECPHYRAAEGRCEKCGCFMSLKTKLRSDHCPIGKW